MWVTVLLFLLVYETSHQRLTELNICAAEHGCLISVAPGVAHITSWIMICTMGNPWPGFITILSLQWVETNTLDVFFMVFFSVTIIWQQFLLLHQHSFQLPHSCLCASPNASVFSITRHLLLSFSLRFKLGWEQLRENNKLACSEKPYTSGKAGALWLCWLAGQHGPAPVQASCCLFSPLPFVSPSDRWLNPAYSVHAARSTNNIPP